MRNASIPALTLALTMPPAEWAELPPEYATWDDLQRVVAGGGIPTKLRGIIDRIGRVGMGQCRAHSDRCSVAVEINRQAERWNGSINAGPSPISGVVESNVICK